MQIVDISWFYFIYASYNTWSIEWFLFFFFHFFFFLRFDVFVVFVSKKRVYYSLQYVLIFYARTHCLVIFKLTFTSWMFCNSTYDFLLFVMYTFQYGWCRQIEEEKKNHAWNYYSQQQQLFRLLWSFSNEFKCITSAHCCYAK